eukprot:CAMPEP_0175042218 /NCGR_PEP_ID=MMETSP0052_2-20121109/2424_1 /TAXON_ID=51329 ORGANISM="Polytomella parva, Strain SAG 63-3" /NCGR_SAMPLE_ID=MMETSP0052_2 /ASSEMBLY_ACC=CAM_ASM_000194 /LENGTH=146 /DNA_ID=CAMNT_0016304971 /DNA_START=307 /DNA_END=743 /DNA_ORIENTATION=-
MSCTQISATVEATLPMTLADTLDLDPSKGCIRMKYCSSQDEGPLSFENQNYLDMCILKDHHVTEAPPIFTLCSLENPRTSHMSKDGTDLLAGCVDEVSPSFPNRVLETEIDLSSPRSSSDPGIRRRSGSCSSSSRDKVDPGYDDYR